MRRRRINGHLRRKSALKKADPKRTIGPGKNFNKAKPNRS